MDKNCKTFHMHFPRVRPENFRYNLPAGEGMNVCQIFLVLSLTNLNGELLDKRQHWNLLGLGGTDGCCMICVSVQYLDVTVSS